MKWPSRRNSVPNEAVSCTSIAWNGDWKCSNSRVERTKKPVSSVRYSVNTPGSRSEGLSSGIAPAAVNGLEFRALRPHRVLHCAEQFFGLGRVVGRIVADVDVDRAEAVFGPGVDRQVRFGQKNGPGHRLR